LDKEGESLRESLSPPGENLAHKIGQVVWVFILPTITGPGPEQSFQVGLMVAEIGRVPGAVAFKVFAQ
jgi:hypothetical protein